MFNQNFVEEPLAVYNSFQFAYNNKINLALDLTIPLFAFDNGVNSKAYAFYIRPNIGNLKPWFTPTGELTTAYKIDHEPNTKLLDVFKKRFSQFNFNFSMLKVYWNINNKKHCQITTELQAASSSTILKISQTQVEYSKWGKVIIPAQCLDTNKANKISLVINAPNLGDNDLVTKNSYQEFYLNFNYKKDFLEQTKKLFGIIQYKNYDEKQKKFKTFYDIFANYFQLIPPKIVETKLPSLFALRSLSVFNSLDITDFPIDLNTKIAKLWTFFNNQHLLIPTTTTVISKQTKYNFKILQGYLKYNLNQKVYEHFFAENTVYNQNKDQIEIEANNNLAVNNFLVNPFLAQSEINFITTIEQFNFNLVQNFIFKPIIPKVNINNNFFVNSNWFKCLTTTYRIITQQLPNYYNKEFNQDLLAQFEFDFFVEQKLVIDEKNF